MDIVKYRKLHRIRPECLIITATLWPEFKDGWSLSHPHHFPRPLQIYEDGSLEDFAEDRIGIEYRVELEPPLDTTPAQSSVDMSTLPCVLTLSLPTGKPFQAERLQVLLEAESKLTPLARTHEPCVIVGTVEPVVEYGHRFTRFIPVAVLTDGLIPLWVHPAAFAFGLLDCEWPARQQHRHLGEMEDPEFWGTVIPADFEDPSTGLPAWYARHRMASPAEKDPFEQHGAFLNAYAVALHQAEAVDSRAAGFYRASQEFHAALRKIFGCAGDMGRGHPRAA